jgi:hypothetical protein
MGEPGGVTLFSSSYRTVSLIRGLNILLQYRTVGLSRETGLYPTNTNTINMLYFEFESPPAPTERHQRRNDLETTSITPVTYC